MSLQHIWEWWQSWWSEQWANFGRQILEMSSYTVLTLKIFIYKLNQNYFTILNTFYSDDHEDTCDENDGNEVVQPSWCTGINNKYICDPTGHSHCHLYRQLPAKLFGIKHRKIFGVTQTPALRAVERHETRFWRLRLGFCPRYIFYSCCHNFWKILYWNVWESKTYEAPINNSNHDQPIHFLVDKNLLIITWKLCK